MTAEDRVQAALVELGSALVDLARETATATTTPPAGPVELLSIAEASRRLSISRSSLYQAIAAGRIRSVRVGGRRLIGAAEIARIAAGERGAA